MRFASSIVLVLAGMVAGIGLVISCGDDAPAKADAAVDGANADAAKCDCPAAEPPLTGRFMVVSQTQVIPANDTGGQTAACPVGSQLISGSCTLDFVNPGYNVTLRQSGFYEDAVGWHCDFRNNEAVTPVTIKASAICLKPMP